MLETLWVRVDLVKVASAAADEPYEIQQGAMRKTGKYLIYKVGGECFTTDNAYPLIEEVGAPGNRISLKSPVIMMAQVQCERYIAEQVFLSNNGVIYDAVQDKQVAP